MKKIATALLAIALSNIGAGTARPAHADDRADFDNCYNLGFDVGRASQAIYGIIWLDVGPFDQEKFKEKYDAAFTIDPDNAPGVPDDLLEQVRRWKSARDAATEAGCRGSATPSGGAE